MNVAPSTIDPRPEAFFPPDDRAGAAAAPTDLRLPLVFGVTGHRDIPASAWDDLAKAVRSVLLELKSRYPNTPFEIISPLAEGADRLVAEVAVDPEIGARMLVPMPMPRTAYEHDFATAESRAEFARMLTLGRVVEMALPPGVDESRLATNMEARRRQYIAVGEFVARHCQVLIALWDGRLGQPGGTAQVFELKHAGSQPATLRPVVDEVVTPGPIYHIVTPRVRHGADASAISSSWIYPESDNIDPAEAAEFYHRHVLKPLDDYNRDLMSGERDKRHAADTTRAAEYLIPASELGKIDAARGALDVMRAHYAAADALAGLFQARTIGTLYRLSIVAFIAALSFDISIHVVAGRGLTGLQALFMAACPCLLAVAILIHRRARVRNVQDKYQDYRGLAEGLRVQFFWRMAGIDRCVADHYLGRHRWELDWIRNGCRASLTAAECPLGRTDAAIAQIVGMRWIDDQRAYFERAAARQGRRLHHLERAVVVFFRLSAFVMVTLAATLTVRHFYPASLAAAMLEEPEPYYGLALMAITMSAVMAGLIHNYIATLALEPQVRMYSRMARLYRRRGEQFASAQGDARLAALFDLGCEALSESGAWVTTHRERPLEVPHS